VNIPTIPALGDFLAPRPNTNGEVRPGTVVDVSRNGHIVTLARRNERGLVIESIHAARDLMGPKTGRLVPQESAWVIK
jgi:hypothetical protein